MKKMAKVLALSLSSMLIASSLVACGGGSGNSTSGNEDTPIDVKVNLDPMVAAELEIMVPGGNSNEQTMIDCLIDDFALLYPNVEISMSYISVNNYVSNVRNQALAGTLPDILWSNTPDFYDVVSEGAILNLTPYLKASEEAETLNTYLNEAGEPMKFSFENDFYTEFFDMTSMGEKCYVIPRSCDSIVTFYNKDIFTKAGVDMTKVKNGWTWDEFMDVCAAIRTWMDNNGHRNDYVVDANLTSWLSVCYPMLVAHGSEVISEDGKNIIDCPETQACVELVREMVEKRYIIDSKNTTSTSFETGNSAMLFQSASISLYANKPSLKGKIDLVSFPLIMDNNTPKIGAGAAGYSICSTSKNKDVAWAFLSYLLSQKGQQKMALNGLNLASIRKDLSDHTKANWGKNYENLNLSAYTYGAEYKIATEFFTRTKLTAKAAIQQSLVQLFTDATNASKPIADAISSAKRGIDYALIDY